MTKNYFGFGLMLACVLLSSCRKNDEPFVAPPLRVEESAATDTQPILFVARRVPIPKLRQPERLRSLSPDATDLRRKPYNVLGAVHRVGNGFLGHPLNIGNDGVLDISSL